MRNPIIARLFRMNFFAGFVVLSSFVACSSPVGQVPDSAGRFFYTPVDLPEKIEFAGEKVPLEYYDVRENLDRELLSNAYFHSQTIRYIKTAPRIFSIIEPILKENGIPDDFKYLCAAESGFDVKAVSPAKAVGLWQLLESSAKENGLEVNAEVDERYHIEKSTQVACKLLKAAYSKYGSWAMAAASYNGGIAGLDKKIAVQKASSYYDLLFVEETTRYVFRILALKLVMENPEKYGFKISKDQLYPIIETQNVTINTSVPDWADFAIARGITYKELKAFNPWLRETFLKNPMKRTYILKIPAKDYRTRKY